MLMTLLTTNNKIIRFLIIIVLLKFLVEILSNNDSTSNDETNKVTTTKQFLVDHGAFQKDYQVLQDEQLKREDDKEKSKATKTDTVPIQFLVAGGFRQSAALQGKQVKISADGQRVFLTVEKSESTKTNKLDHGELVEFERDSQGMWQDRGSIFTCNGAASKLSFDASGHGNTVVVKCSADSGTDWGSFSHADLYVLERSGFSLRASNWKSEKLASLSNFCGRNPNSMFSFAVSSDGKTIITAVVAESDENRTECVRRTRVFTREPSGSWNQLFEKLEKCSSCGSFLGISGDGRTFVQKSSQLQPRTMNHEILIISRLSDQTSPSWTAQHFQIFIDMSPVRGAQSVGYQAMLSYDGNVLVVSQFCNSYGSDDEGRAIVFTFDRGEWRQKSILVVNDRTSTLRQVGLAMAMSSNADVILLCGDVLSDPQVGGACWLFSRNGNGWILQEKYTSEPYKPCSQCGKYMFGRSVHMTPDAASFVVGGFDFEMVEGGAEVFKRFNASPLGLHVWLLGY